MNSVWQCLFNLQLSITSAPADQSPGYTKYIRINKLTHQDSCQIFVDLRLIYNQGHPTMIGITMYPQEFRWLLKKLIAKNVTGKYLFGKRILMLYKKTKKYLNLKLTTPKKEVEMWFT